ncbi:Uncharacterised protein [Streptococcus equi subsp. equi]|nr:Uncharacterised protein [Streptococcus equi subsp. equi]CRS49975.1 Uncharacterised protein [Streptococcus equi subsp. equi]CRS67064.1 Uncharacterised protein [Streptococcus equi subsp. equi]CRS75898.1 Uncharacterised protein [Streptococcus equi subsp. equi]CRT59521.1 Uncharacterised protein [Streptococcus equi subsp. equi]
MSFRLSWEINGKEDRMKEQTLAAVREADHD